MQVNSSSCYFQFRHDRQEKSTDDSVLFLCIGPLNPKKKNRFYSMYSLIFRQKFFDKYQFF